MINYGYLNSYLTYNLWFFNFLYLGIGIGLIINNYRNDKSIPNCDGIFTLICLMLGGSGIPVLTFSQIQELNLLNLLYSLGVASYAIPNYQNMEPICKKNYSDNYNNLWCFYLAGIILHIFNVVLYISKFYLLRMMSLFGRADPYSADNPNRRLLENESRDRNEEINRNNLQEEYQTTEVHTTRNMYPNLNNIYENDD